MYVYGKRDGKEEVFVFQLQNKTDGYVIKGILRTCEKVAFTFSVAPTTCFFYVRCKGFPFTCVFVIL